MRRIALLSALTTALCVTGALAVPTIEWVKTFDGIGEPTTLQRTTDGGYVISGEALLKVSESGEEEWRRIEPCSLAGESGGATQLSDGDYAVVGVGEDDCDVEQLVELVRTDAIGHVLWDREVLLSLDALDMTSPMHCTVAVLVYELRDGGILLFVLGYSSDLASSLQATFSSSIVKTDSAGVKLWEKTLASFVEGETSQWVLGFSEESSGDLAFIRTAGLSVSSESPSEMVTIDSDTGAELGTASYDLNPDSLDYFLYPFGVLTIDEPGRLVHLADSHGQDTGVDLAISCVTSSEEVLWTVPVARTGDQVAVEVDQSADGGFIILGYEETPSGETTALLVKLSADDEIPNEHSVGTPHQPSGPDTGSVSEDLMFVTYGTTCSQGHSLEYRFDWGNDEDEASRYSQWSSAANASHSYDSDGSYEVRAQSRCSENTSIVSGWSEAHLVSIGDSDLSGGFWAEVSNAPLGVRNIRDAEGTEESNVVKRVPNGWVLWVVDVNEDGELLNGHYWWQVEDRTDPSGGDTERRWMASESEDGTMYLIRASEEVADRASSSVADTKVERAQLVLDAIANYWIGEPGNDLYSPSEQIAELVDSGFPIELALAIASYESDPTMNNASVSYDCGRGIMQMTTNSLVGAGSQVSCLGCSRFTYQYDIINEFSADCWGSCCWDTAAGTKLSPTCSECTESVGEDCGVRYCRDKHDLDWRCYCLFDADCNCVVYSNTPQGVFANIKDGLHVLGKKLEDSLPNNSIENPTAVFAGAVFRYNGWQKAKYLPRIGAELGELGTVFPDYRSALTQLGIELLSDDELEVLAGLLQSPTWIADVHSPVEMTIRDSSGRITGMVDGLEMKEIPDSECVDGTVFVFNSTDTYSLEIVGTGEGEYGLTIVSPTTGEIAFWAVGVPVTAGETHAYEFDWDVLAASTAGEGAVICFDYDGDGVVDHVEESGAVFGTQPELPTTTIGGSIRVGPNPIDSSGVIFFYDLVANPVSAELLIANLCGRVAFRSLLDPNGNRFPVSGTWNPVDQDGIPLANGPYVYVLIADGRIIGQGKMVIQR